MNSLRPKSTAAGLAGASVSGGSPSAGDGAGR